jgi:hypothetical protein
MEVPGKMPPGSYGFEQQMFGSGCPDFLPQPQPCGATVQWFWWLAAAAAAGVLIVRLR